MCIVRSWKSTIGSKVKGGLTLVQMVKQTHRCDERKVSWTGHKGASASRQHGTFYENQRQTIFIIGQLMCLG